MSGDIDSGQWRELGDLFDELGDLPPAGRDDRLAALRALRPELAMRLAAMLAADGTGDGLLERSLDDVAPQLHAQLHDADWATRAGQVMGRYRLLSPLGSGGMGEVWLAERADGEYRQNVALKLLKRGMDTAAILRRFLQERSILARLSHPNIVRLLDGGMSDDGRPFYAMEHVDGMTVVQYAAARTLGVRARVALVVAIADAVSHAHAQLVVHRDLKPSNILVDAEGAPHLLDFGIAKLLEDTGEATMTGTQVRVMSPAYAAPEQILGEPVGTATDVYALGVILYELLTGELPHRRTSRDPAVMAAELRVETGRPSQVLARSSQWTPIYGAEGRRVAREVAGDLDLIFARATHRDPLRRYPTMAAFADDLRRWLDRRPIVARPDSARYRTATFVRRHRVGVAAAAAAVLALVLGLGAALWQAGEARQQAARAEQHAARAERVKEFLIALFRQNDPEYTHGQVLTAAQVMATGVEQLSTMLADDPQTRGELFVTIAEIQYNLGDMQQGLANVEQGLALLGGPSDGDDGRTAQALAVRGQILASLDHPVEAEADLLRAVGLYRALPGGSPDRVDDVEQGLATVYRYTRDMQTATTLMRDVVTRSAQRHGENSLVVARRRLWHALLLEENGEFASAEATYRLALPIVEQGKGALDPGLSKSQLAFAGLLDRVGKREEAAAYFERSIRAIRQIFGEQSGSYGTAVFSRGIHFLGRRMFIEAEADFRAALKVYGGSPATDVAHSQRYLGQALFGQERFVEAAELFRLAEASYRRADLPRDAQRWRARADYGYARFRMGELEDAATALDEALAGLHEVVGDDNVVLMRPLMIQGEILRERGDVTGALAAHRRWRGMALANYGDSSPEFMQSGYQLTLDLLAGGSSDQLREAKLLIDGVVDQAQAGKAPLLDEFRSVRRRVDAALAARPSRG